MKQYKDILFIVGAVLLLVGAVMMVTGWRLSPYIYTVGALFVAFVQLTQGYKGTNVILRRLYRQQMFGAIALLLTGLFMFTTKRNEWVVCLAIAAVLELYTAYRIPYVEGDKKE